MYAAATDPALPNVTSDKPGVNPYSVSVNEDRNSFAGRNRLFAYRAVTGDTVSPPRTYRRLTITSSGGPRARLFGRTS